MRAFRGARWVSLLSLAGALAGVVGCGQQAGSTSAAEPTSANAQAVSTETMAGDEGAAQPAQDAADARPTGPRPGFDRKGGPPHGAPGPEGLLMAALHELELTSAQKAAIQAELDKNKAGARPSSLFAGAPTAALAQGVRAGKIDKAEVLTRLGALDQNAEAHRAALASSLETLHTTLTKEQRGELVDALKKRAEGRGLGSEFGPRGPHEGRRHPPEPGAAPPGGAPLPGPLGFLLDGVELTEAQREAVGKVFEARKPSAAERETGAKRHEAMQALLNERLATFVSDSFDAKAFVTPPEAAKAGGPRHPLEAMIDDLSAVVPLLTSAQRETLAARLEKGPPAFAGRMGGPPGERGRHARP